MNTQTTTGSDAVDLDRLEKLASNAEQMFGKWFSTHQIADGITDDDAAAFIAAMTPGTVVALIAQARAAAPAATERQKTNAELYTREQWEELSQQPVQAAGDVFKPCTSSGVEFKNSENLNINDAAPVIAASTAPKNLHDALRQSGADRDYHGRIAFLPAQFERFVSLICAPTATSEPMAILRRVRELAEKWNKDAIATGFAGSEPAYELFELLDAATAPQQAAPLTDAMDELNWMRIRLVQQIDELIDVAERYSSRLVGVDDEGHDSVRGAIEYAREVAAPYRYNGALRVSAGSAASAGDATAEQDKSKPCRNVLMRVGYKGVPKSCPRCGLAKECPAGHAPSVRDRAAMAATKEKKNA